MIAPRPGWPIPRAVPAPGDRIISTPGVCRRELGAPAKRRRLTRAQRSFTDASAQQAAAVAGLRQP
jgi:hypothetical protein